MGHGLHGAAVAVEAAEEGRQADGAADVGGDAHQTAAGGDERAIAAGAAPWDQGPVVGVGGAAEGLVYGVPPEEDEMMLKMKSPQEPCDSTHQSSSSGTLVCARGNRPRLRPELRHGGVHLRPDVLPRGNARAQAKPLDGDAVLAGVRHAEEGLPPEVILQLSTFRQLPADGGVEGPSLGQRLLEALVDDGVDQRLNFAGAADGERLDLRGERGRRLQQQRIGDGRQVGAVVGVEKELQQQTEAVEEEAHQALEDGTELTHSLLLKIVRFWCTLALKEEEEDEEDEDPDGPEVALKAVHQALLGEAVAGEEVLHLVPAEEGHQLEGEHHIAEVIGGGS
ncbi:hypothetical protein TYRP_004035 [Tyrophagus putrescentiae]|nr:hypothetical protein TYRP_004035 [Tyrophagus putrescentiae]